MSVERGVMVMKDLKAWGVVYDDGQVRCFGWIDPEKAAISDETCVLKPEDLTYKGSADEAELRTGRIVRVEREITVRVLASKENS